MDERLRFISRRLEGKKMAPLYREIGIRRVTGYKFFNRCNDAAFFMVGSVSRFLVGRTGVVVKFAL